MAPITRGRYSTHRPVWVTQAVATNTPAGLTLFRPGGVFTVTLFNLGRAARRFKARGRYLRQAARRGGRGEPPSAVPRSVSARIAHSIRRPTAVEQIGVGGKPGIGLPSGPTNCADTVAVNSSGSSPISMAL